MSNFSNLFRNTTGWKQVFQLFIAYLVAAWTFLQFIEWILNRYAISPYWVEIFIWIFIGIIPSLLIYLFHRDRINQGEVRLKEKIIFPLNIIIIIIGLYFGFGTTDLGATTKSINYTTEAGEARSALITKEEFRTGFMIYNFEPKVKDTATDWLEFGIAELLHEDLLQNKNLSPEFLGLTTTANKVEESSYFYDYYIDGDFEKTDSTYIVNTYIRNAKNAKIIAQTTASGPDILNLIDQASVFITSTLNSKEFNSPNYLDLDLNEITSSNLKALKHFVYGDYDNAIAEDSTFALAYLFAGKRNLRYSRGNMEEQSLADKAYDYRYKLPLQRQSESLVLKYLAYDQFDKAEELVKLQLEVDPSSDTYNQTLKNIYGRTKNVEAYTQLGRKAWENEKNRENGVDLIEVGLIEEEYNTILEMLTAFAAVATIQDNEDVILALKFLPQLYNGDFEEAEKTLNRWKLLEPELEIHTSMYEQTLSYLKSNEPSKSDLIKFNGDYRSDNSEQVNTIWLHNNTLLSYISNQGITPLINLGDQALISGHPALGYSVKREFIEDDGKFYAFRLNQYNGKDSLKVWYWRLDPSIVKAEQLFASKQWDSANVAYEKAIASNPNHYYLEYPLAHIRYRDSLDAQSYTKQLEEVAGTYSKEGVESKRRFWVEDDRLFYKRAGLATKELYPISRTQYLDMVNTSVLFEFEYENEAVVASMILRYDTDLKQWEKNADPEVNYLPKD